MYVPGIRPPEMKSDYTQGTVRETPGIMQGSCSEGASNLPGRYATQRNTETEYRAEIPTEQWHN